MDVSEITLLLVLCSSLLLQNLQATPAVGLGVGVGVGVGPLLLKKAVIGTTLAKPLLVKKGLIVATGAVIVTKGQGLMAVGGSIAAAKGATVKNLVTKKKSIGKAMNKAGTLAVKVPILVGGKVTSGTVAVGKTVSGKIAVKSKSSGIAGAVGKIVAAKFRVGKAVVKHTNSIITGKVKISKAALASGAQMGSDSVAAIRDTAKAGLLIGSAARERAMTGQKNLHALSVVATPSHDLVSRRSDLILEHMRDIAETKGQLIGQYRAVIGTSLKGTLSIAVTSVKKTFSQGTAETVKSVGTATGILGAIQKTIGTLNQQNVIAEEKDFKVKKPAVLAATQEVVAEPNPHSNVLSEDPNDDFSVFATGAEEQIEVGQSG